MLSDSQLQDYRESGFVVLPGLVSPATIRELSEVTDSFVEQSRNVLKNNEVFDLEPTHNRERPRLRRLKNPHKLHAAYRDILWYTPLVEPLRQILGPSFRLHGGVQKVNMKLAGDGSPVNWHQDWAFYPHTNDDLAGVSIFLDDVDESNGPLMAIPGTHKGPVYDHRNNGVFCGAIDCKACGIDTRKAVPMTGPAGTVAIHHVRTVHGSVGNRSTRDRRMLIFEFAAADAWPLCGTYMSPLSTPQQLAEWNKWIICGEPTYEARVADVPIRLPLPHAGGAGSVYEIQRDFPGGIDADFDRSAGNS